MSALLKIEGLSVRFGGVQALDRVTFDVEEGQFVGLIGPNGAGKTTFMDAVTGLVPSDGRVALGGREVNSLPAYRRVRAGIGRTFQSLELFEDLTVRENLMVAAADSSWRTLVGDLFSPRHSTQAVRAVDQALDLIDLRGLSDALPSDLSLGERKLVTVARALAQEPQILLLDEPAAGLDSGESIEFGDRMKTLVNDGVTVVMIDHDMGLILRVCDEVQVLDFGRLIASGTPEAIRNDPTVIGAYLGADDDPHSPLSADPVGGTTHDI